MSCYYQIQVNIADEWECGDWIEVTENGITGERIEARHETLEAAEAELADMFAEMELQGMDFARDDWRVVRLGNEGAADD